jgi:hypothetical protein
MAIFAVIFSRVFSYKQYVYYSDDAIEAAAEAEEEAEARVRSGAGAGAGVTDGDIVSDAIAITSGAGAGTGAGVSGRRGRHVDGNNNTYQPPSLDNNNTTPSSTPSTNTTNPRSLARAQFRPSKAVVDERPLLRQVVSFLSPGDLIRDGDVQGGVERGGGGRGCRWRGRGGGRG